MTPLIPRTTLAGLIGALLLSSVMFGQLGTTVPNWSVPPHHGAMTTMGDITGMLPFIGVTPCRIVDTRGAAGPFGGPAITGGTSRNFALPAGPCTGIPSMVAAYSLNITATGTAGAGFIKVWPEGGTEPLVSTLNYVAGQTVANAAIVPAGSPDGGITVKAGVSTTDLIIDINGYFTSFANAGEGLSLSGNIDFSGVIDADNASSTGWGVVGFSHATTNIAAGVEGDCLSTTGRVNGVNGVTSSSTAGAAGVFGQDGTGGFDLGASLLSAGVWGSSGSGYGVLGISMTDAVKGVLIDAGGNVLTSGHLGHDGTNGVFAVGNVGATGAKTFIEPHPTRAGKAIVYVSLEGPEAGTYFRGSGRIVNGESVVHVPEDFRMVTDAEGLTVQLTPVGELATMAVISEDLDQIIVRSNRDVKFHYLVNGVRKSFKDFDPMGQPDYFVPEGPEARVPAAFTAEQRNRLVANGTYNEDGTVNIATAQRLGWTKIWADREAQTRAAAQKAAAERAAAIKRVP